MAFRRAIVGASACEVSYEVSSDVSFGVSSKVLVGVGRRRAYSSELVLARAA